MFCDCNWRDNIWRFIIWVGANVVDFLAVFPGISLWNLVKPTILFYSDFFYRKVSLEVWKVNWNLWQKADHKYKWLWIDFWVVWSCLYLWSTCSNLKEVTHVNKSAARIMKELPTAEQISSAFDLVWRWLEADSQETGISWSFGDHNVGPTITLLTIAVGEEMVLGLNFKYW